MKDEETITRVYVEIEDKKKIINTKLRGTINERKITVNKIIEYIQEGKKKHLKKKNIQKKKGTY